MVEQRSIGQSRAAEMNTDPVASVLDDEIEYVIKCPMTRQHGRMIPILRTSKRRQDAGYSYRVTAPDHRLRAPS